MDKIKVLWMNNGDEGQQLLIEKGRAYHLFITASQCMTDCYHKLDDVNTKWDAVVLNAEVKTISPNSAPSAIELIKAASNVSKKKLPWFVVTSKVIENPAMVINVLPEGERYYNIKDEYDILFDAIRTKVSNNPRNVVRKKYDEVYRFCPIIEDLLVKLEYADIQADVTILNECRKILEWIKNNTLLSDMYISADIIKELVKHYKKNNKRFPYTETYGKLSLNDFSYAIGRSSNVPVFVQRCLYSCVSTANSGSHNTDVDNTIRNSNAPYVTKTLIYDLLNILHWCALLDEKTFEL